MKKKIAAVAGGLLFANSAVLADETAQLGSVKVTSASGFEQKIKDAPASISVISNEDLRSKAYANIAEAIEDIEGVDVRDGVGKTGGLNISIRGMGGANTLILIDGRRQNLSGSVTPNGFNDSANSFLPPLAAIERIEVIRGPMSTLYGSDAMGGVVNIITKKITNEWIGAINVDQTLQEDSKFGDSSSKNLYISGPLKEDLIGVAVRGSYYQRDASSVLYADGSNPANSRDDKGRSPMEGKNWAFGTKFTLLPTDNHSFFADFITAKQSYDNSKEQMGTLDTSAKANGYKDRQRFERIEVAVGHESKFDIGTLNSSLMQNNTETFGRTIPGNTIGAGFAGFPSIIIGDDRELKSSDTVFDTKLVSGKLKNNTITVGGQFWKSELTDGVVPEKFKQDLWGVFAEDEILLGESLTLTIGGRYDHHDKFDGHFSPRAYAVWEANSEWTIKGGVGNGFKAPSINDLHDGINSISGQGTTINIGTPSLKPEKSTNTELGVYYEEAGGFLANATVFYNLYKDKIESSDDINVTGRSNIPDGMYAQKKNIDKAETKGLELATTIPMGEDWKLKGSYTFLDSEKKSGKDKGAVFATTPKHAFNATLSYEATSKLTAHLKGEYKSKRERFNQKYENLTAQNKAIYDQVGRYINAYEQFHLGLSYKAKKDLTFKATVYNIMDKDFTKSKKYTYINDKNVYTEAYTFTDTAQEGRRLWLSMNLEF